MANDSEKKRWKEESEQLKKDLQDRPKIVERREVPIKFGGMANRSHSKPSLSSSKKDSNQEDDFLRKQLGL